VRPGKFSALGPKKQRLSDRLPGISRAALNLPPQPPTYSGRDSLQEALMSHWHDTMVDQPTNDGAIYATGWTISGLAVLGTIVAVWILGI
jgi:hypothetical protein